MGLGVPGLGLNEFGMPQWRFGSFLGSMSPQKPLNHRSWVGFLENMKPNEGHLRGP